MISYIFGVKDLFSCVNFCLKWVVEDSKGRFSDEVVNVVIKDFYVDDFVKFVRIVNEVSLLVNEVICLFSEVGFRFMKWMSNSWEVLFEIFDGEWVRLVLDLDFENFLVERMLGV